MQIYLILATWLARFVLSCSKINRQKLFPLLDKVILHSVKNYDRLLMELILLSNIVIVCTN